MLIAPDATTHAFDMNQRHVELQVRNRVGGQGSQRRRAALGHRRAARLPHALFAKRCWGAIEGKLGANRSDRPRPADARRSRQRRADGEGELGGLGGDQPRMRFSVKAGPETLRSAKLKLPKQLRFASGQAFDDGGTFSSKTLVKPTRNGLKIKARQAAETLRGRSPAGRWWRRKASSRASG